ncbi:IS701 family transposase [Streptomyces sp. NPDC055134]
MDLQVVEELAPDLHEFAGDVFKYLALQAQRGDGGQYVRGLLLDGRRKSVEPMAERLGVPRQNLGHSVGQSTWDYTEVMRRVAVRAAAVVEPTAWIIDDHPFVRYGHHTAGAMVQHCGERGQHLCQVAVSVHATSQAGSTPLHWRLFVSKLWAEDRPRSAASGIPDTVTHRTKQQLALDLVDELNQWGLAPPLVIADSDYGNNVAFRTRLSNRGIPWLLAVTGDTFVLPATGVPVTARPRRRPPIHVGHIACGMRHPRVSIEHGARPGLELYRRRSVGDSSNRAGRIGCKYSGSRPGRGACGSEYQCVVLSVIHGDIGPVTVQVDFGPGDDHGTLMHDGVMRVGTDGVEIADVVGDDFCRNFPVKEGEVALRICVDDPEEAQEVHVRFLEGA